MNLSYLDISLNSDSSFNSSFDSNRNVGLNKNDGSRSTEQSDCSLRNVSIASNTSVICITPPKHESDPSSPVEG